jgi:hypothetical protein
MFIENSAMTMADIKKYGSLYNKLKYAQMCDILAKAVDQMEAHGASPTDIVKILRAAAKEVNKTI